MAKEDKVLAIDIGATSIKLCEFDIGRNGSVTLAQFAYREYEEELSEGTRMNVVAGLLRQMLAEGGFRAKRALVSLSGQSALMRFSRLGNGNFDRKNIRKMAEFEATNNIPFPVNEVLYDYQLIAAEGMDQIDVLSVVIKNEVAEQFTQAVMTVGCDPIHVDIAPVACFNAARANGLGDNECVIILNIGGRNTSLLFAEGERFFARNIPTAGHSITQQIAKEFSIGLPEAEELKRRHGFVALGGAYAEPESETAANVSKIIRSVMARLHGEIARSISIYRSQQHGSQPVKMYLTGGSSILNYCDVFFQEKLGIPVEYFNPFQIVELAPSVDKQRLAEVAHMFSETIGLALRSATQCPIEIDLVPVKIQRQQRLTAKKPYFFAAGAVVMMTLGIIQLGIRQTAVVYDEASANLNRSGQYAEKLRSVDAQIAETAKYKSMNDELEAELMKKCLLPGIYHEIALLRPDYLTITSIRPVYTEEELDLTMTEEDLAATAAMGADPSMGGMGMGMGMGMASPSGMPTDTAGGMGMMAATIEEKYSTLEKTIYGFEIVGFSFKPNTNQKLSWSPEQNYWTDFAGIIELPSAEGDADASATAEPETDADGNPIERPALTPRQIAQKQFAKAVQVMATTTTPDQAFMENLLQSPLFDAASNPRKKFKSELIYAYPLKGNEARRYQMSGFAIKVKLAEPARTTYNEYVSTVRSSAAGGMGAPGGMMQR